MKKILLLCLAFLCLGSLSACSKTENKATADGEEQSLQETEFPQLAEENKILNISSKDTDITVQLDTISDDLIVYGELLDNSGNPQYDNSVNISFQKKDGGIVFQSEALLLSAVSSDSDILKHSLLAYRIHSERQNTEWHLLVRVQNI